MSTIQSLTEESTDTGIDTLGEETPQMTRAPEKIPHTKQSVPEKVPPAQEPNKPPEEIPHLPEEIPHPPEEKPPSEKCISEKEPQPTKRVPDQKSPPEIRKESCEKRFGVFYLVSTILSPPLKAKHVKECLKQYQKTVDKAMKKSPDSSQHYRKAQLVCSPGGIIIMDDQTQTPQAFYERATISGVQSHPDGKCAFAFMTVVSGNTKHKCHLFLQDK
jgi:outer membrane biosynthesis protein TonB